MCLCFPGCVSVTRVLEEVDKVRCFAPSRQVVRAESWVPTPASSVQRPRITVVLRRVVGTDLSVECPTTANNGRFAPSRGCRPPRRASNDRETIAARRAESWVFGFDAERPTIDSRASRRVHLRVDDRLLLRPTAEVHRPSTPR